MKVACTDHRWSRRQAWLYSFALAVRIVPNAVSNSIHSGVSRLHYFFQSLSLVKYLSLWLLFQFQWKVNFFFRNSVKLHVRLILSITSGGSCRGPPPLRVRPLSQSGLTSVKFRWISHYMIFDYYFIASKWMSILSATGIYIYIYMLHVTVKIMTKREPPERFQKLVTDWPLGGGA